MSNERSQNRVRERKRDVLKQPFRQGFQWIGSRLEEFRGRPHAVDHGPMHNIGTAGNVFSGVNYGLVTMMAHDDFTTPYLERLRVAIKANHMYYATGDESALRRSCCTPGTRIDILQGIINWAINRSASSEIVYWLSGQAGAGKTTIAYTVACQLETLIKDGKNKAILGGSFFCSRQFPDTRSASSIVRTIVYQLALRSKPFRKALQVHGRFETVNHGPRSQLMGLLVEPWIQCLPERRAENEPCYAFSIDALDELEGTGGVDFLSTLFDIVNKQDLSGLKFFITSRSEPALAKQIDSFTNKRICRLEEVPLEQSSTDIKIYLNENLAGSVTPQQIEQLVSDSAGLFIYAATVVEYIKGRGLEEQRNLLQQLLSTSPSSHRRPRNATARLDSLYLQILETCLVDPRDRGDPDILHDCLSILHTFLCTVERTSVMVAVAILQESNKQSEIGNGTAEGVLLRLHAVLYSQGGQVMSFHKSFSDFLFDKDRSKEFYCNQEQLHHCLAAGCFGIMARQLRFNIANIATSYQMDCDVPALPTCIDTNISAPLRYACRNWNAHLILAPLETLDGFAEALHKFLQLHILFWMEAMNLLGQRGRCQRMLRDAQQWFTKSKGPTELVSKLTDAAAFAAYHSASKAALSTPHLYLSSLATFSRCSTMVQNWRRQFCGIPGFISAHGVGGQALVACITFRRVVKALAVSPDGVKIAVGSPDGLVQILDLSTGEEVGVLKGHTGAVDAVAYSPDGRHVVSGSGDNLLRVWNVSTGEEVGVLEGHTGSVEAVAYSPDGTHVVSGSSDKSFRIWDVSTGEEVRVLEGHTDHVYAVAYSPDGTHAVSGSYDNSVRVWDVITAKKATVLRGHTRPVCAVAYSPNGRHVVSGSLDESVRVWDVSTGKEVRVLKGHTNWVYAVAYSPDGRHVVSGSCDKSVRVWDVSTGEEVRVFEGHTGDVCTVAYLPDGSHIISGSTDKSLRVWDMSIGEELRVLKGHYGGINTVAYLPDGTYAVSGSSDRSLWVWDVSAGEVLMVLNGHLRGVNAVAYSQDGSYLVSASTDNSLGVWCVSTGEEVRVLNGHTKAVQAVAYSPDRSHVVSGSLDKSLRIWDVSTGRQVRVIKGHSGPVHAVAYSLDGSQVVSGSDDKSVRVWDVSRGEEVRMLEGHTDSVRAVACLPDGIHVVSGSDDQSLRVWDMSTGEELRVLKGHFSGINAVACSPDGSHVVSGSSDRSLRLWDVLIGAEVRVLEGHADNVRAVAYSPDGTHVISGSDDKSVRVWNVSPGLTPRYVRQQGPKGEHTGWLLSPNNPSLHLMLVPLESLLPDDSNILTMPSSAVPHLDLTHAKLGDRWAECYTPWPF